MTAPEQPILDTFLTSATATERLQLVETWLAESEPNIEALQYVLKDLTQKDKGAARPVRERLDRLKSEQQQAKLSQEWAELAQALLQKERMGIAEGLAWLRDATKAKAPLSKEPLSGLRQALQERMDAIEDLQNQVAIQKEAALLLTQRIETYSTKSWLQANGNQEKIEADIQSWLNKKASLEQAPQIHSIDLKYEAVLPQLEKQIEAVWQAFQGALGEARSAAKDLQAALPAIPVWAEEIREQRNAQTRQQHEKKEQQKAQHNAEHKAQVKQVFDALQKLETELGAGHGKASIEQAQNLRELLKQNEGLLDARLFGRTQSALAAAGELADWQRWRTDQIREDLIQKAEALLSKPLPPRKQQETLRTLRESWKQSDQGGIPNNTLWKIFDQACNRAHEPVEIWLAEVKKNEQANSETRKQLIEELRAFASQLKANDWRAQAKAQQRFETRWRDAGHIGEKAFTTLIASWKEAMQGTFSALSQAQQNSLTVRKTFIEQATQLAEQRPLPVTAIQNLQTQWRQEAQSVPLNYRQEQKLWARFRKILDTVFVARNEESKQRRAAQRAAEEKIQQAIQTLNTAVQEAGDAQAIHVALDNLHNVAEKLQQDQAKPTTATATTPHPTTTLPEQAETTQAAVLVPTVEEEEATGQAKNSAPAAPPPAQQQPLDGETVKKDDALSESPQKADADPSDEKPQTKKIVAARGDDRPQAQKAPTKVPAQQTHRFKDSARSGSPHKDGVIHSNEPFNAAPRKRGRFTENTQSSKHPNPFFGLERNLSTPTFNAFKAAKDKAFSALKDLQREVHDRHLLQFLESWKAGDSTQLPKLAELSKRLTATNYHSFAQSIQERDQANPATTLAIANKALLRLEIMQQLPSPASVQNERRAEQLYLLTQKNQVFSWEDEIKLVLRGPHTEEGAKRLQAILKKIF